MEHAADKNLDGRCQEQVNNIPGNTMIGILMDPGVGEIGEGPHNGELPSTLYPVINHTDDQGATQHGGNPRLLSLVFWFMMKSVHH
jgi:hypothetical protein